VRLETKLGIGGALLTVLMVCAAWYSTTSNGQAAISRLRVSAKQRTVVLKWNASTSTVTGYNVYRGGASSGPFTRVNGSLVPELSYTDQTVVAGSTYYYVTTAVDSAGVESGYSNAAEAVVP